MKEDRKKAILDKASEITHSSEQYQLIHATYAARSMIKGMVMNYYKKRYDELSSCIAERLKKGLNIENQLKEKVELDALAKRSSFHIDGTQGSRDLTDGEEEAEADYFGSMLIKLRRQRNEKFYQDKAYVTF